MKDKDELFRDASTYELAFYKKGSNQMQEKINYSHGLIQENLE